MSPARIVSEPSVKNLYEGGDIFAAGYVQTACLRLAAKEEGDADTARLLDDAAAAIDWLLQEISRLNRRSTGPSSDTW